MKSYLLQFVVAFGAVATFVSCSKDLAGSSYGDVQKQKYAANFVAKYGEIDANQSWISLLVNVSWLRVVSQPSGLLLWRRVLILVMCRKSSR